MLARLRQWRRDRIRARVQLDELEWQRALRRFPFTRHLSARDQARLQELVIQFLYEKRFTIEGARARLRELGHDEGPAPLPPPSESDVSLETLRKIKQGLADLIRICAD